MAAAVALTVALGFAAGSLPWGLWLGRWCRGVDVRAHGSGNLGATNVYRLLGARLGLLTLALDILKGALPVALVPQLGAAAGFPGGPAWCAAGAGVAAVAGHMWTPWAGFRGGKGVATTVGVLLALAPLAFAVFVVVFATTLAISRYVSLGSILGSLAFVLALAATAPGGMRGPAFLLGAVLALLILVGHRDNLRRLRRGEEHRFAFRRRRPT